MKNLLTSAFLLISILSNAQLGVHAGANLSSYTGGSAPYTGMKNSVVTLTGGLYNKFWLNKNTFLQAEIDFLMMGAKNPSEAPENFNTYHIHVPVVIGKQVGQFSFQAGLYVNQMLRAGNKTWFGVNTFDWDINGWYYLDHRNVGGTVGVGYDFIGMEIQASYLHDFNKTQNKAWDYDVKKLGYNQSFMVSAYFPFKIKTHK